jgi:hypothetical protein
VRGRVLNLGAAASAFALLASPSMSFAQTRPACKSSVAEFDDAKFKLKIANDALELCLSRNAQIKECSSEMFQWRLANHDFNSALISLTSWCRFL